MRAKSGSLAVVVVVLVAGATLLWAAGSARAQPAKVRPDALAAYEAGQDAFKLGEYEEARRLFEKARKLQDLLGTYRWLAATAQAQERWEDCVRESYEYLRREALERKKPARGAPRQTRPAADVPRVRELHETCRDRLNRPSFRGEYAGGGAITVRAQADGKEVDGVTVRLNGLKSGATPMQPRAAIAGPLEITLEHERYKSAKIDVEVVPGIVLDVIAELKVNPDAVTALPIDEPQDVATVGWVIFSVTPANAAVQFDGRPAEVDARGRVAAPPGTYDVLISAAGWEPWRRRVRVLAGQVKTVSAELRNTELRHSQRRRGYLALGAAAACATAGAFFGLRASDAREEAQDIWETEVQRPTAGGQPQFVDEVPLRTRADLDDAVDRAERAQLYSALSFGVAAVALGVSIYYFVQERPEERAGVELPLAVVPLDDGDGGVAGVAATYSGQWEW